MEMEPICSDDIEVSADDSPYLHGINGEPEVSPRVGDQYQAEIPLFVSEYDRLNLVNRPESEKSVDAFGLPIPLMWTRSEKFKGFRESEPEKVIPSTNVSLEKSEAVVGCTKPRSIVLALPCQRNAKLRFQFLDMRLYPFPGTLGESWEDAERERFLLGLYCLGKNLASLQKFVGSKKMGDMLSYYYGIFYGSREYKRWVDGRKSRCKRSVQGQKLLTGWRQQELLSRVSSHLSDECKSTLVKVSKEFREDKIAIEEYVFSLKSTVGIGLFTEAVGIGKGKKDLTNCALEPTKSSHGASGNSGVRIRNDLPVSDIVKFLTGEYRMSKTRSSDLFWEAVWPRLLARGWHSEQPKDGPKNSLVFLVPEANKFSRRKMSKGNQYFDSLTDVLNKVALDPTLLELKTDEGRIGEERIKNDEPPVKLEEVDDGSLPNKKKKKRYLQPRNKASNSSKEVTMFTIVDTSKNGEEGCLVRELRSLPVETGDSIAKSPLSGSEDNVPEESESKVETTASRVCGGGSISSSGNMDNATSRSTISVNEKQKTNRKPGRPRKLLPVCTKRSSLAECTLRESACFDETQSRKKKKKPTKKETPNPSESAASIKEEPIDTLKLSSTGSFGSCVKVEDRELSPERPEFREDFDLNVSVVSLEREANTVDTAVKDVVEMQCKPQEMEVTEDQLPGRRQSTRTRPLTTKALEAFAFGYLGNSKKKRKDTEETRSKSRKRRNSLVSARFRNGTIEDDSDTDE